MASCKEQTKSLSLTPVPNSDTCAPHNDSVCNIQIEICKTCCGKNHNFFILSYRNISNLCLCCKMLPTIALVGHSSITSLNYKCICTWIPKGPLKFTWAMCNTHFEDCALLQMAYLTQQKKVHCVIEWAADFLWTIFDACSLRLSQKNLVCRNVLLIEMIKYKVLKSFLIGFK